MKKVGLTGGIGSGKTTVASVFSTLGVPVYNSDKEARIIINKDPQAIEQIKRLFGNEIYKNNELDRKAVASIVFNDSAKLKALNDIVHPKVGEHFNLWCNKYQNEPYIIKETAVLFSANLQNTLDSVIVVVANESTRISRVMKRDNVAKEAVEERIKNQMSSDEMEQRADFVINNSGEKLILPDIIKIHNQLVG